MAAIALAAKTCPNRLYYCTMPMTLKTKFSFKKISTYIALSGGHIQAGNKTSNKCLMVLSQKIEENLYSRVEMATQCMSCVMVIRSTMLA
jgi:hypothetical protein